MTIAVVATPNQGFSFHSSMAAARGEALLVQERTKKPQTHGHS
jgi:hypothetical protein